MQLKLQTRLEAIDLTAGDIILGAYRLLETKEKWAKGVFLARDRYGREVNALHFDAQSWSLIGALRRSADDLGLPTTEDWAPVLWEAYNLVEKHLSHGYTNLLSFNNAPWTTYEDVIKALSDTLDELNSEELDPDTDDTRPTESPDVQA